MEFFQSVQLVQKYYLKCGRRSGALFFLESRVVARYAHEVGARTVPSTPSALESQRSTSTSGKLPRYRTCEKLSMLNGCLSVGLPVVHGRHHQIPADHGERGSVTRLHVSHLAEATRKNQRGATIHTHMSPQRARPSYFVVHVSAIIFHELLVFSSTTLTKPSKRSGLPSCLKSRTTGMTTLARSPSTSWDSGLPGLKS